MQNALLLQRFVAGKSLRQVTEAAREAQAYWSGSQGRNIPGICVRPATINRRLCVLKAAAKHAYKMGWIDTNLSGRITLLPVENKREVYLIPSQVKSLALSAPSITCRAAILIAAYSGLRASELLALPAVSSNSATLSVRLRKTGKPRSVPIVGLLRPYLSALPLGLSYWQPYNEFCKAREAAGMPHVRFHDLRHSTASMLISLCPG